MFRPLWLDLLGFLGPLCLGGGLFYAACRWPLPTWLVKFVIVPLSFVVMAVVGLAMLGWLPLSVATLLHSFGGGTVILACAVFYLLGIVWVGSARKTRTVLLTCLAATMILIETSGRLWWRFFAPEALERTADAHGRLRQGTGRTCGPAAAVMLLRHYGIEASEGEMAYRAGCTVLGTDAVALVQSLTDKITERGGRAEAIRGDYAAFQARATPFIALVRRPGIGRHAILVEELRDQDLRVVDPLEGQRGNMSREDFEAEWERTGILVFFREKSH